MSNNQRWLRMGSGAFWFLIFLALWIGFAPVQLGGRAVYIIIVGNSMEPGIHNGDLVISRRASDYQVGDIATYHNPEMGRLVLHRIIGQDSGRFIFQGDNNPWVDSYQPIREELIGKAWVQIPSGGRVIQWLRLPIIMGVLAGALAIFLMANIFGTSKRQRDMFNMPQNQIIQSGTVLSARPRMPNTRRSAGSSPAYGEALEGLFYIIGLVALASLALCIFSFITPLWHDVPSDISYQQAGEFSYSASAPAGIYDSQSVATGQPIFLKLTCDVTMQFTYTLAGDKLQDLAGTHQLAAKVVENTSGWSRTFALEPQTAFNGTTFSTSAPLNLCQVDAMLAEMEGQTGLQSSLYSIVISPNVVIGGKSGGQTLNTMFQPKMVLHFDSIQAYLVQEDPLIDPLKPVANGVIGSSRTEMNTISLFGLDPKVLHVRTFSLVGFFLSLSGLLILWQSVAGNQRPAEGRNGTPRYDVLVDHPPARLEMPPPVMDVASKNEFSKLAAMHNAMILHYTIGATHFYQFKSEDLIYRFRSRVDEDGRESRPAEVMVPRLTIRPENEDELLVSSPMYEANASARRNSWR